MSEDEFLRRLELLAEIARHSLRGHERINRCEVGSTRRSAARSLPFRIITPSIAPSRLGSHRYDAEGTA
jgi:hypothetical protein